MPGYLTFSIAIDLFDTHLFRRFCLFRRKCHKNTLGDNYPPHLRQPAPHWGMLGKKIILFYCSTNYKYLLKLEIVIHVANFLL